MMQSLLHFPTRRIAYLLLFLLSGVILRGAGPSPLLMQEWDRNNTLWLLPFVPSATSLLAPTN